MPVRYSRTEYPLFADRAAGVEADPSPESDWDGTTRLEF